MSEQLRTIKDINKAVEDALNSRLDQEFDLAISIYQQLINSQPNNPIFYDELAQTQAQKGIAREAIFNYQKALELGIKNKFWTYKNLGDALRTEHRLDEAIVAYQEAIKSSPKNPNVYDTLGQVYSLKQNFPQAIENYTKALELGIKNPIWTYKNLAKALETENQLGEAISIYQELLKLEPDNSTIQTKLAQITKRKEEEEANNNWLKVYEKGEDCFKEEQWEDSIQYYKRSIELNPNFFWSHYNLGRALSKLKQFDPAITSYQQAIKIEPQKSYLVYLSLGAVFKEQGELDNTIDTYKRTIEIFPEAEKSLAQDISQMISDTPQELTDINTLEQQDNQKIENKERLFPNLDDEFFIKYLYKTLLKRPVDSQSLQNNLKALRNNVPRRIFLENLLQTEEFLTQNNQSIVEDWENPQFLRVFWELLLGRECGADAERVYLEHLENGLTRIQFISEITKSHEFRERAKKLDLLTQKDAKNTGSVWIMGTQEYITQKEWDHKLLEVFCSQFQDKDKKLEIKLQKQQNLPLSIQNYLSLNKKPLVSVITSLYKGKKFIEFFLENITNQTIFDATELIIIDANSPEREFDVIKKYMVKFGNIKYIRTEQVIDIYEAWNIGIKMAKGEFLTNANLDDLRRFDCLEKQAETLLNNENIDVVYQDFYYSMTPNLPFEVIEKCGYKSQLPAVNEENMLQFNSPHNAPMWRKSLHEKVGLFNTAYKSAGDYELWMRALLQNSKFLKIEESLVVYYNNPSGISTRTEGHGALEAREIQVTYQNLFTDNLFSLSHKEFIDWCRNDAELRDDLDSIELSTKPWQKKLMLLDRCFENKLTELSKDKFYFPLQQDALEY